MTIKCIKNLKVSGIFLFLIYFFSDVLAADTIIKKEKMSFDTCLKVISTSKNKLSLTPEINKKSDLNQVATFKLTDGSLKIICDGENELITVSTSLD